MDWRVEFRAFKKAISPCNEAIAVCKDLDCETSDSAADFDWDLLVWMVSATVVKTACTRASFSGFGGIGGAGPDGAIEGISSSNGEVSKSGVSFLDGGATCGGLEY